MSGSEAQRPAVTVALPVYNGAGFLDRTIGSVLAQRGWQIHLVAVNDASTDASADVLARCATTDERISVVTFDSNCGVAAARNAAVASTTDPLIAMIDQDDTWSVDHLDTLWRALNSREDLGFVMGHQEFTAPDGPLPAWVRPAWLESPQAGYVFGAWLAWRDRGWEEVGDLDESLRFGGDDVDWFIRADSRGVAHQVVPEVVLHRRIHSANASQRTGESVPELFEVLRRRHR